MTPHCATFSHMLVGFGQTICRPVGPRCDLCDVAKVPRLCPSKRVVSPKKSSPKKLKLELKEEDFEKGKPEITVEVEEVKVTVVVETVIESEANEVLDEGISATVVESIVKVEVEVEAQDGSLTW